ncbi:sensor histidine kinase [Pedococcus sp. 2YAF34]|uniref:sensor histidine kinase n=1 Tax=Pedococcus sp. 2YAF34 TaxID=3233032 RepID=UPI003F9A864E
MRFTPSSLRNRLVLGAVALGLTFAVLFGAIATWRVHHAEEQAVRAALQTRLELARDEVSPVGSLTHSVSSPKIDLIQVIGPDGRTRSSSDPLARIGPLADVSSVRKAPRGVENRVALQSPDIDLAVLAVPLTLTSSGDSPAGTGALVVAVDAEGFNATTSDLLGLLIAGLVAVVVAITGLSWILTGRALRNVTQLTERAEAVRPKDLAAGLAVPRGDAELARLVEALNRMLARLHQSHATELAFAADAGHRLRTPVATLRAEAELALRESDPVEMTAALERVVHDADQLTSIVDRMLARSRARDHDPEPVLAALSGATPHWKRQAELGGLTLAVHTDDRITPRVVCADLREIIEPIVDNAVRHTPAGGVVTVDARLEPADHDTIHVSVSNTGPPVEPEIAPYVFDAWVSSRDASVAGGLGLWLAREAARDHGGDVTLLAGDGTVTTFRIALPLTNAIG